MTKTFLEDYVEKQGKKLYDIEMYSYLMSYNVYLTGLVSQINK